MKQRLSKISPFGVKKAYRLLRYPNERKRLIREFAIRKEQDSNLRLNYDPATAKLIIFIVPGADPATGRDNISGGTMSIVSICEETVALRNVHHAATIMCTLNDDTLFLQHRKFANNTLVYRFEQLARYFSGVKEVLIHLPEFLIEYFPQTLNASDKGWLNSCDNVHVNIMNQNIRLMPEKNMIDRLRVIATKMTMTTAHQKYCTQDYRDRYAMPLHKLSVWISPEQYDRKTWEEKENLIVVSPDAHPMKEDILNVLHGIDGLKVQIIQSLTYEQYKTAIARAKWSLTFGEGLDGYFIEPVFSGAASFAVYNEQFFTPDFKELDTVYPSVEVLRDRISNDIKKLDSNEKFSGYQEQLYKLCSYHYSKAQYRNNIAAFYSANYTYA